MWVCLRSLPRSGGGSESARCLDSDGEARANAQVALNSSPRRLAASLFRTDVALILSGVGGCARGLTRCAAAAHAVLRCPAAAHADLRLLLLQMACGQTLGSCSALLTGRGRSRLARSCHRYPFALPDKSAAGARGQLWRLAGAAPLDDAATVTELRAKWVKWDDGCNQVDGQQVTCSLACALI